MPSASNDGEPSGFGKVIVRVPQVVFIQYTTRMNPKLPHGQLLNLLVAHFPNSTIELNFLVPENIELVKECGKLPVFNQKDNWTNETGKPGLAMGLSPRGECADYIAEQVQKKFPNHVWAAGLGKTQCVEFAIELSGFCEKGFDHLYRCTDTIPAPVLRAWADGVEDGNPITLRTLRDVYGLDDILFIPLKWDPTFHQLYFPSLPLNIILQRAKLIDVERGLGGLPKEMRNVRFG